MFGLFPVLGEYCLIEYILCMRLPTIMYSLPTHTVIDEYLGAFQFGVVVNNAAVNIMYDNSVIITCYQSFNFIESFGCEMSSHCHFHLPFLDA